MSGWLDKYEDGGKVRDKVSAGLQTTPLIVPEILKAFRPKKKPSDNLASQPSINEYRELNIVDPRTIRATTGKPMRENSDRVSGAYSSVVPEMIVKEAKTKGLSEVDAWNLLSIGLQETGWGSRGNDIGQVSAEYAHDDPYHAMTTAYIDKMKTADRLKWQNPELRLQLYNGVGTIYPTTESDYRGYDMQKIYGVPIPKKGLDMRKNPLYGKQIINLRDSVLKMNPEVVDLVNKHYETGGKIKKDPVIGDVKDAYDFIKSYHQSPKFKERYNNMYKNDLAYDIGYYDRTIDKLSEIVNKTEGPIQELYKELLDENIQKRASNLTKIDEYTNNALVTAKDKLDNLNYFTLRGEDRQPLSDQIIRKIKGRPNPRAEGLGSHYIANSNTAYIYRDQAKDEGGSPDGIAAHEFSHVIGTNVPYPSGISLKQYQMLRGARDEHDADFHETKADIDAFRYLMNKNKIYDARTEDFTEDHLWKARDVIKDFTFDRLQRLYKDKDLIELMNTVADNNSSDETIPKAEDGKIVKKTSYRNKTRYREEDDVYESYHSLPEVRVVAKDLSFDKNIRRKTTKTGLEMLPWMGAPFMAAAMLPSLVMAPVATAMGFAGSIGGMHITDNIVRKRSEGKYDTWSEMMQDKANFPQLLGDFTNPGGLVGGVAGSLAPGMATSMAAGYRNLINAATKNELYKFNPFAGKIDPHMAYKPVTEGRAKSLLQGEPLLKYSPTSKTKSYLPIMDKNASNVEAYKVMTNRELFGNYGDKQSLNVITKVKGKEMKSSMDLGSLMNNLSQKKFAGDFIKIGNKTITLPKKNKIGSITQKQIDNIYEQVMAAKGGFSNIGSDATFTWGKLPSYKKGLFGDKFTDTPLFLRADPTKMSLVGAPGKNDMARYVPKDIGNFALGKTAIPEQTIIGKSVGLGDGLELMRLHPTKGYIPLSKAETTNLISTGKFTPDRSRLTEAVTKFEPTLQQLFERRGEIASNPLFFISDKLSNQKRQMSFTRDNSYLQASAVRDEMTNRERIIKRLISKETDPIYNKLYLDKSSKQATLRGYKSIEGNMKLVDDGIEGVGENVLKSITETGKSKMVNFRTGEEIDIAVILPGKKSKYNLIGNRKYKSVNKISLDDGSEVYINPEYIAHVQDNIRYIEEMLPGSKVFGSSRGVADAGLPHIMHDYDVMVSKKNFDKFIKDKFKLVQETRQQKGAVLRQYEVPTANGNSVVIDVNLIDENAQGRAIGVRAQELYRQFFPDEYYAKTKVLTKWQDDIDIPYTADELMEAANPTVKTIVDSYEIIGKPKHINRIDSYISYANPEMVRKGQEQFVKSLVGGKGNLGHQFDSEFFADAELNKKLLKQIDFIGDVDVVAVNPQRMQVALNDFYINNTVLSRGVDRESTMEMLDISFKIWSGGKGGTGMGIGQNHTTLGDSSWGEYYGHKQVGLNLNIKDPHNYVDSIKKQVDGNYLFTEEEKNIIGQILNKHSLNINTIPENSGKLINILKFQHPTKPALDEISKATGKRVSKYDKFGNSDYASTLDDFNEQLDALEYTLNQYAIRPKSYDMRKNQLESLRTNGMYTINSVKEFQMVKELLSGGVKRAEERLAKLDQYYIELGKINDEKLARLIAKDRKYIQQKELHEKLSEEHYKADQHVRRLRKMIDRIDAIEQVMKIGAVLGSAGYLLNEGNQAIKKDNFERVTGVEYEEASQDLKNAYKSYNDMRDSEGYTYRKLNFSLRKSETSDKPKYKMDEKEKEAIKSRLHKISSKIHQPFSEYYDREVDPYGRYNESSDMKRRLRNNSVEQYPSKKTGGSVKKLKSLPNFTQQQGWLDKYE